MATVLCNHLGNQAYGGEILYVDVLQDGSGINRLAVDASLTVSELKIGAVEIKDGNSDRRADVEPVGSLNALIIYDAIEQQMTDRHTYDSASVAYNATVTVWSYTVPASTEFRLTNVEAGGNADGEFTVEVGGSTVRFRRNSAAHRTIDIPFNPYKAIPAGTLVAVKAKNISFIKQGTRQFEVGVAGYTIPA